MNEKKKSKVPFFARYLKSQELTSVGGGGFTTLKHPSDNDEAVTQKFPSDDDEAGEEK
jgi:serine endopeptidase inhibitor I10-like protein